MEPNIEAVETIANGMKETGTEFWFAAVSLIMLLSVVSILAFYFRRLISRSYVKIDGIIPYLRETKLDKRMKDDLLDILRESYPEALLVPLKKRTSLLEHECFSMIKDRLASIGMITFRRDGMSESDAVVAASRGAAARDISRTILRVYRSIISSIIYQAYRHDDGFNEFFGDKRRFHAIWTNAYTDMLTNVRQTLIQNGMSPSLVGYYEHSRTEFIDLVRDMITIAVSSHSDNYWRTNEILNLFYAFSRMTISHVTTTIAAIPDGIIPLDYQDVTCESRIHLPDASSNSFRISSDIDENVEYKVSD